MPKTAVDEDRPLLADPSDVGLAGNVLAVEAVAGVTQLAQEAPHKELRGGVLALDAPHRVAALLVVEVVSQRLFASLGPTRARPRSRCISQ